MRKSLLFLIPLLFIGSVGAAQEAAATEATEIAGALKELGKRLAEDPRRDELRQSLGRSLREQISAANRRSSAEWAKISTRQEWERFRADKLKLLRDSLGTFPDRAAPDRAAPDRAAPDRAAKPRLLVTRELAGERFKIRNVVYESRPGLVVTANLYVPDPPRDSMPGILLSHSHHNPKHEGELQDMGMTWARAGCCVLVPDHLGHGERRQHPFVSAADYAGQFQVGRQDYYFRYDTSLQLYLVGESLMGWMVHDLMTGVDVLLAQPGVDLKRIILLGAVAGGGDPAAVTAALDERIAGVVPFNFGGPQPENRYPLPDDAETSFNYAGGGSWESTRNLRNSARDGFLPWVIVGSVAPRRLIHAHEFSWDRERDPAWKRYEKVWGLYDAKENLAFTTGFGTIQNTSAPASHCNNIGAVHRKPIHEAFRRWFAIDVKPEDEYKNRRTREELTCLTDEARKEFQPKPLFEILAALADKQLAAIRDAQVMATPEVRRRLARESWTRLLGDTQPPKEMKVLEGSRVIERIGPLTTSRELLETDPGIAVRVVTISYTKYDGRKVRWRSVVLGCASDGIEPVLERRPNDLSSLLRSVECVVALVDVRGSGATSPGSDRGQQGASTAHSATALMLGRPMLSGQLRDLRSAWQHILRREDVLPDLEIVAGGTGVTPLSNDGVFAYPRRIEGRPRECEPTGALLTLLFALFEDTNPLVLGRHGLTTYRSALDSPFVQVPHECIIPGVVREGDLPLLVAALPPREVALEGPVDARGRRVSAAAAELTYEVARQAYLQAKSSGRLEIGEKERDEIVKP